MGTTTTSAKVTSFFADLGMDSPRLDGRSGTTINRFDQLTNAQGPMVSPTMCYGELHQR